MSAVSEAVKRLREALTDRPRGHRGPKKEQLHVAVIAEDVLTCCAAITRPTPISEALHKGCSAVLPETEVTIQADDAYHLIDLVDTPGAGST